VFFHIERSDDAFSRSVFVFQHNLHFWIIPMIAAQIITRGPGSSTSSITTYAGLAGCGISTYGHEPLLKVWPSW
jgi:hypothetical protein